MSFIQKKSTLAAINIINNIIDTGDSITIGKQYQVDNINPKYRRMISGHYKILYKENGSTVSIMNIVDTRQDPSKLERL